MIGGYIDIFYKHVEYRNTLDWDTWRIKKMRMN